MVITQLMLSLTLSGILQGGSLDVDRAALTAKVDKIVQAGLDSGRTAGVSIGISHRGDMWVSKGYGFADIENEVPAKPETVYRIASITKQMTAAATLALCESDELSLQTPLSDLFEDLYPKNEITVHHLLNHTSGIPSYTSLEGFMANHCHEPMGHERMMSFIKDLPLDFKPGESFNYNNSAYYILGMVIEEVSGVSFGEFMEEEVFSALEMKNSVYGHQDRIIKNRAHGYQFDGEEFQNCQYIHMNIPGGAGAICSTVGDLIKWTEGLFNEHLISREFLDRMLAPTEIPAGPRPYGYGLQLELDADPPCISHGGGIFGFSTQLSYFPKQGLTVAVLSNCSASPSGDMAQEAALAALEMIKGS